MWWNFSYFIQSNLFFKDENPNQEKSGGIGDLFVSALSLKKTTTTETTSTTPTTTFSTPTYKSTNTRTPHSQTRKPGGAKPGLRSKVCLTVYFVILSNVVSDLF